MCLVFFFNDTATTEIYTLSLHDALPICKLSLDTGEPAPCCSHATLGKLTPKCPYTYLTNPEQSKVRSEEHTSELQSRQYLVCRLLLEKKKKMYNAYVS